MVTFSIVMPCHKCEKTIKKAIESVIDQDFEDWELICVVNGSWKKRPYVERLIDGYKKKLPKKIIRLSIIAGNVCNARNRGAREALGKYISFFSSDFYMFPGTLRKWKNEFDSHSHADFIYGGYQLMRDGELLQQYVPSQPYDPWMLEIAPYIDGGFPVKREVWEKCNWDTAIKSLNDWDWWIGIAKAGFKGYFFPDYTYAAEVPKEGGLSYDSSQNWLDRVETIKKKWGIKQKDICVVSLGAAPHGKKLAKILDADFLQCPQVKPHKYKMIYLIGYFIGDGSSAVRHSEVFGGWSKGSKKVVHWIGTDVLQMVSAAHQASYMQMLVFIEGFRKMVNLTEFEQTHGELLSLGLESEMVPLPVEDKYGILPLPKKFTIAVYTPATKTAPAIYNLELMKDIVKSCPDINFLFFGGGLGDFKADNLENVGWTDMKEVMKKSSCLLRFTIHDGLPITPIEFRLAGRDAMTSVQLPYIHFAGTGVINKEEYAKKKEGIIKVVREVRKGQKKKGWLKETKKARRYWKEHCDPEVYKKRIYEILNEKDNKSSRGSSKSSRREKR
jgi:glycosyltransferase involved in cell wall biosynthesis